MASVCLSVCMTARDASVSPELHSDLRQIVVHVTYGRGSDARSSPGGIAIRYVLCT